MATYAVGDIQGCYNELRHLLDHIGFDPAADRLWSVGDLVNRGPDSVSVLRWFKALGDRAAVVLGNHDLHLLALAAGNARHAGKSTLNDVLTAPDRDELLHWLRHRPLLHLDEKKRFAMVHAGLPPQWDLAQARACAAELEATLQGPGYREFLHAMYGNQPDRWSPDLAGMDRLRFITNCFTRLRYCTADGRLLLREKRAPGLQPDGAVPWFKVPGRASREHRIVFGHWSTLGYLAEHNVWALDTGCLWGGRLTAVRIRRKKPIKVFDLDCAGYQTPG
ncbi:symmetrical bis(5'-nucleosyl)-tetraphosphatase [Thiohalocapsa marina]|uniref:Bis(5'-nucleosyl)-tetraphosphatase, symmetrical n=1 Tax=Thiohalocapsa marina TaxID=424902 RepID=A0A5M8FV62_9GAMM|nr:symmetrical bis(5'-nucleosyl)-tetraphosphatase [Thiohalocapsa marina]KAA6187675.1 symmetrical bis(5'-nucleosyl)-tetraphosphatase [Thiohalocapsa marina]